MLQLINMAFRDLGRNRRRSFFSALALGMGLSLLLLMASVVEGEIRGGMNLSIRLESGHVQVRDKDYDADKSSLAWEDLVENPQELADKIASLDAVAAATPRLYASGIVSKSDTTSGVRVIGVDPASDANAPYRDGLLSGSFLSADDREGILIGQPLADKLKVQAGDSLNLLVNTANGEMDEQPFTVRGIYSTGTSNYDETNIFLPLAKAQAIAQADNHASAIFILLKDRDQADAVAAALQTSRYEVKTFEQLNQMLTDMEDLSRGYMVFLYLIVLAITATVIVNTLVMSVFERTREIGILSAIGMKGFRIMSMFFIESVLLAAGGVLIGLALGSLMVWYASSVGFYFGNMGIEGMLIGDRIYGYLTLKDTIQLTVLAIIVTLLGAIYPAALAARMEPVQALRGGE